MKSRSLKIISYNIHKGYNFFRKYVLPDIRTALNELGADLVFLQEIKGLHSESEDQILFLAGKDFAHMAYGKNNHQKMDHYGNAILSRFPLLKLNNLNLTNNRLEKRGLLATRVAFENDQTLHAFTAHLDLTESSREKQIRKIVDHIHAEMKLAPASPMILAGDFNDWGEKLSPLMWPELQLREAFLEMFGEHAASFPSARPFFKLDRIYFRGFEVNEARVLKGEPWSKLSDHLPLYVELEWVDP